MEGVAKDPSPERCMAVPPRKQALYWGMAAILLFAALWLLGDVLLPFLLGGALAYFLDPVADRLERLGLSRVLSVTVISVISVLLFVAVVVPAVLTLENQITGLIADAPDFADAMVAPDGPVATRFPFLLEFQPRIEEYVANAGAALQERSGAIVSGILTAGRGILGIVLLMVIVPVVAFYLLLDWDRMVARVDELLPREHAPTIRRLAREIDRTLAGFLRGQGTVMLVLGTFYAVALALVGLNFGIVIGAVAGLMTFIPYVGAIVGGGLSIGVALVQFWGDWVWIAVVAGIFALGQILEGNVLTPKLVGGSVGLHPVWLIFALSAFGAMFGFIGLLAAVPVAAVIGVIARFAVERYRASALYQGIEPPSLPLHAAPPRPTGALGATPGEPPAE